MGLFVGALSVLFSRGFAPTPQRLDATAAPVREAGAVVAKQLPPASNSSVTRLVRSLVVGCLPMFTLCAMRQARSAVIPLVGAQIGLRPHELGVLVGIASMAETVLFLPAGFLYDTIGKHVVGRRVFPAKWQQ